MDTQADDVHRQLFDGLEAAGARPEHLLQETVFFRDIRSDFTRFVAARLRAEPRSRKLDCASVFIEEPPLAPGCPFELLVRAFVPAPGVSSAFASTASLAPCACPECPIVQTRTLRLGEQRIVHAGNIVGLPGSTFDETLSMFRSAEEALRGEGMDFRDVVRTWIYLRHMEEDYAEFNRARRAFFLETGVTLRPASTGIHGAPFADDHGLAMGFIAVSSPGAVPWRAMTSPTLNEACEYGADFSRGMRVEEANKVALHVSGTASVDERGRTVHVGDFEAQARRMLLNIAALLRREGASFRNVLSAVTYLRDPADAKRLAAILREDGIGGFPHAMVRAHVCRPDLLCEMEVFAALPPTR